MYYYHTDQLGSVRALTNSAGSVVDSYTYDAYGSTTSTTGSVANPFRYTGQYTDSETGFLYLRARYYDPQTQQFLTVDPLVGWTEQAYAYVGGSPTYYVDPTGLEDFAGELGASDSDLETPGWKRFDKYEVAEGDVNYQLEYDINKRILESGDLSKLGPDEASAIEELEGVNFIADSDTGQSCRTTFGSSTSTDYKRTFFDANLSGT